MPKVSHENYLIFMRMTAQVTHIFIPIVSLKDSFCHSGKSKLGIGLFIHELLREPLIFVFLSQFLDSLGAATQSSAKQDGRNGMTLAINYSLIKNLSRKLPPLVKTTVRTLCQYTAPKKTNLFEVC